MTLKSFETDKDINLYVTFHVMVETSASATDAKLVSTIASIFDEGDYGREFISEEGIFGGEIVYRFQKPLLKSDTENRKFFSNLKTLFVATGHLNPHFTQNVSSQESSKKK